MNIESKFGISVELLDNLFSTNLKESDNAAQIIETKFGGNIENIDYEERSFQFTYISNEGKKRSEKINEIVITRFNQEYELVRQQQRITFTNIIGEISNFSIFSMCLLETETKNKKEIEEANSLKTAFHKFIRGLTAQRVHYLKNESWNINNPQVVAYLKDNDPSFSEE